MNACDVSKLPEPTGLMRCNCCRHRNLDVYNYRLFCMADPAAEPQQVLASIGVMEIVKKGYQPSISVPCADFEHFVPDPFAHHEIRTREQAIAQHVKFTVDPTKTAHIKLVAGPGGILVQENPPT